MDTWHILLVDDNEDDYFLTRSKLKETQSHRIELDWAPNYEAGQQRLQSNHYDAVLVDYDLCPRTGIEFIRETEARGFSAPLILYSERTGFEVDLEAMQAGATLYLAKSDASPLLLERTIHYAIERKLAKEALSRSQKHLSRLVDTSYEGIWSVDQNGKTTFVNQRAAEILGYSVDEIQGQDAFQFLMAEDVEAGRQTLAKIARGESGRVEAHACHKDGRETWLLVSFSPVLGEQGEFQGALAMFSDITEGKLLEEQLKQSEKKYADLVKYAPAGIYEVDFRTHRFTSVNDAMCELSGYSRDELLEMSPFDILDEAGKVLFRERIHQWLAGEEPVKNVEYRVKAKDGHTIYALLNTTFICDESGKPLGATVVGFDITEDKRREQNAAFIAEVQEELARCSTTGDILQLVGEKIYHYLGISRLTFANIDLENDELIGIYEKLDAGMASGLGTKSLSNFLGENSIQELSAGKVIAVNDVAVDPRTADFVNEYQAIQARSQVLAPYLSDGRWKYLLSVQHHQPYDWRLEDLGLISELADRIYLRVERVLAEAELRDSEQRFRTLADGTPVNIWVTNPNGQIEFINRAYSEFFGVSQEQVRDTGWQTLVHPDDRAWHNNLYMDCLSQRLTFRAELRVKRSDGEWRWIDSYGQPLFSPAGEFMGMAGSSLDITDRKRTEAALQAYTRELKRSNQALQDFAFMASHDLREPLRKVATFGHMLKTNYRPWLDEQAQDYIDRMQAGAERMQRMLDGLTAYSRITLQGNPFEAVDLNRVAAQVLSDLEVRLKETGGQVELEDLPVIQADPLQMQQLLLNLIGNALKFHRPGVPPQVKVTSRFSENGRLVMVIADNGIGFDPAVGEKLFNPFHRLVGKAEFEGSGMGLAICQKIAERHSGTITAHSEPGVGSTFTVTLSCDPAR